MKSRRKHVKLNCYVKQLVLECVFLPQLQHWDRCFVCCVDDFSPNFKTWHSYDNTYNTLRKYTPKLWNIPGLYCQWRPIWFESPEQCYGCADNFNWSKIKLMSLLDSFIWLDINIFMNMHLNTRFCILCIIK